MHPKSTKGICEGNHFAHTFWQPQFVADSHSISVTIFIQKLEIYARLSPTYLTISR